MARKFRRSRTSVLIGDLKADGAGEQRTAVAPTKMDWVSRSREKKSKKQFRAGARKVATDDPCDEPHEDATNSASGSEDGEEDRDEMSAAPGPPAASPPGASPLGASPLASPLGESTTKSIAWDDGDDVQPREMHVL